MRKVPASIVAVLVLLSGPIARAAGPPELEPLAFLLGEWPSQGKGQPGQGSGTAVFTRSLQDRLILRSSYAEYPDSAGKPTPRHDDLMVIYAAHDAGIRANYYDSEGHVIRYTVKSPAPGEAVFLSDAAAGEPRFRLSYKLESAGVLRGRFEVASPDAPDTFKPYLTWESSKAVTTGK